MKNVLTVGILAGFLTLGVGSAFAEQQNDESILGAHELSLSASEAKADTVAKGYIYDQTRMEQIGTEAGAWQSDLGTPGTKAIVAAQNYHYDPKKLHMVATEQGYDEYSHSQGVYCSQC